MIHPRSCRTLFIPKNQKKRWKIFLQVGERWAVEEIVMVFMDQPLKGHKEVGEVIDTILGGGEEC